MATRTLTNITFSPWELLPVPAIVAGKKHFLGLHINRRAWVNWVTEVTHLLPLAGTTPDTHFEREYMLRTLKLHFQ
jgi:hypothetical protein